MSRLNDLLRELRTREPALARDLEREVAALANRRAFGLNFERHVPEAVELPGRKVRKGDKVRVLPPRGHMPKKADEDLWRVVGINRAAATATLESITGPAPDSGGVAEEHGARVETRTATVDDLVVVAEFRDPIYPGLVSTGKVERGGDKPFHAVINAENFHALEALLFTHRGKVDAIYIDPPYNTGAKDWKYNNAYIERDDLYRHSKWLAFMERRLLLAKELLNSHDSVLIITIDEKEYLRLGLLLEQVFPEGRIQMISAVINPRAGVARPDSFTRTEEYLFVVQIGASAVRSVPLSGETVPEKNKSPIWFSLMRTGSNSARKARPNLFYPIWATKDGALHSVGDSLPLQTDRTTIAPPAKNVLGIWPIRPDETENTWQLGPNAIRAAINEGTARINHSGSRLTVNYLRRAEKRRIANGEIEILGKDSQGALLLRHREGAVRITRPRTVWSSPAHDAGLYGSQLLNSLIPGRKFPFPKALFAVEDALRFFIGEKREATILDFFAGSGTTAHALIRINKQDGGRRQCISITNNEVAADEQRTLRKKRTRPGDSDWERWGICEYITKPRIEAAITGKTPNDKPIKGEYKFTDSFPMSDGFAENVEFFTLTYEAPLRVASNREFAKIAPLLWLRAGSQGRRINSISKGWDVADVYGVLADLDHTEDFLDEIERKKNVRIAYIVTDEDRLFERVAQDLPDNVEPVRLYEAYLRNFEIESGRGSL